MQLMEYATAVPSKWLWSTACCTTSQPTGVLTAMCFCWCSVTVFVCVRARVGGVGVGGGAWMIDCRCQRPSSFFVLQNKVRWSHAGKVQSQVMQIQVQQLIGPSLAFVPATSCNNQATYTRIREPLLLPILAGSTRSVHHGL